MPSHDLVFSLGPNCKNAWNTRAHFGVPRAYPFDWWITPAKAMLRMIEPGFNFRVTAGDLVITPVGPDGGNSVYNRKLNLLHHHDFPRQQNVVHEIGPENLAAMNEKYAALFGRLRREVAAAKAPLALLNGIGRGWPVQPGGIERPNPRINGSIEPQALVSAIRACLGAHVTVVIVTIGPEGFHELEGGIHIARPDTGERQPKGSVPSYAEPVHVFRACYAALGLTPAATA